MPSAQRRMAGRWPTAARLGVSVRWAASENLNLGARGCVIIVLHARPEAGGNLAERTGGWRRPAIHFPGPGQEPAAVLPRWLSFPAELGPFRSSAMRAIAGGSCAGRLPVCLLTVLSRREPMRLTGHVTNPGSEAGPNGGHGPLPISRVDRARSRPPDRRSGNGRLPAGVPAKDLRRREPHEPR